MTCSSTSSAPRKNDAPAPFRALTPPPTPPTPCLPPSCTLCCAPSLLAFFLLVPAPLPACSLSILRPFHCPLPCVCSYNLVGFPIHDHIAEAASLKPLIERLKNTNIWLADGPKMQFALAAYVHPYPNNIASVWVYVAALYDARAPTTSGGE